MRFERVSIGLLNPTDILYLTRRPRYTLVDRGFFVGSETFLG